jgi:hypothetical protein
MWHHYCLVGEVLADVPVTTQLNPRVSIFEFYFEGERCCSAPKLDAA